MKLIFASFGTEEEQVEAAVGTAGTAVLCCASCPGNQLHAGTGVTAFLQTLTGQGQSDVHLKLSIVPHCVLPVMIVQVIQIVYFYFGVFN